MERMIELVAEHLTASDPGGVVGLYRYGSSDLGGLQPDSDLDLLVVTRRSLDDDERAGLTDLLLTHSGRDATAGRPVELTVLVVTDVVPWRYPAVRDYLYGEWLRHEIESGVLPRPRPDPDVAVLVTAVLQSAATLVGPLPDRVLEPVPAEDMRRAIADSLPALLADLRGDERNVLLTLAAMVITLRTGVIVPKDVAARRVAEEVPEPHRSNLELAAAGYLGEAADDWIGRREQARAAAEHLAGMVRSLAGSG
jgi:aminoglycoside 9-adenylyltransferase